MTSVAYCPPAPTCAKAELTMQLCMATQENNTRFRETDATKAEAVAAARQRAEQREPSQLKVHKHDGNMEYESAYGADPPRFPS